MLTIGACGFSGTGSSAVSDFLREFDENEVIDSLEFTLAYDPDGLQDLRYHLFEGSAKFSSSNTAIARFRKALSRGQFRYLRELTDGELVNYGNEFLSQITQCAWVGSDPADICNQPVRDLAMRAIRRFHLGNIQYAVENIAGKELSIFPYGKMSFSSNPLNFDFEAKRFVERTLKKLGYSGKRNLVLDQPFSGDNPVPAFRFFENPKAIIVDRDPRDYFVLIRHYYFPKEGWRPVPVDSVENFVMYFKMMRKRMDNLKSDPRVLYIKLEELIYEYEKTASRIIDFCGLGAPSRPREIFKPEVSINNTQFFKDVSGLEREIAYIEENLSDYLFPFEKYEDVSFDRSKMLLNSASKGKNA